MARGMAEDRGKMLSLIQSTFITSAIKTLLALKVPDILKANGSVQLSARDIVARLPLRAQHAAELAAEVVDRIMHALAAHGVFKETASSSSGERTFGLNSLSQHLVQDDPDSIVLGTLFFLETETRAWESIPEAVLDGGDPFRKAHGGKSFLDLLQEDPQLGLMMSTTMSHNTRITMNMALELYHGFGNASVLVDVGGGLGTSLQIIKQKYPKVQAINFDLPHVVARASVPGVENVGGDMFKLVPSGDTILLKWILHNWDDGAAIAILKNCHKSLSDTGKVVIMDTILPGPDQSVCSYDERDKQQLLLGLATLVLNMRAKERTKQEFEAISRAAGFASLSVVAKVETISIIELSK